MKTRRIHILFIFFLTCFFFIITKLFYIQAFQADMFGSNVYLRTDRIEPKRGEIFDVNGDPIVINQSDYKLFVEPFSIKNKTDVVRKLDGILELGEATLEAKIESKKRWVAIASGIDEQHKKKISALHITGLGFEASESRFYPEASLSAHLTGFVGKTDKSRPIGYFGLEGFYEKDLAGLPGLVKTERDIIGKPIIVGVQEKISGENGRDLYLTVDKTAQRIVKQALKSGIERYGAKNGCVIAMSPKNGAIKAFVCLPDFDPKDYGSYSEDVFRNPGISSLFEPGSIFKPLVMAAALNEQDVKVNDTYNEEGPITIDGYEINNWDDTYSGKISMTNILEKSSNVGIVYVGSKMKKKMLIDYMSRYGFDDTTGIDLQGEVTGFIRPYDRWRTIEASTLTFGQGIAITPIQMVTAFAVLVNGGNLVKPHVVDKMISENGEAKKISTAPKRRVLSEKTSREIRSMLYKTIKHGEVKWKIPDGYKVGGKTGTAQVAVSGAYDASKTNASFVGFTPVDDPELIVLVTLKEPTSSPWGSETAAPLFFRYLEGFGTIL